MDNGTNRNARPEKKKLVIALLYIATLAVIATVLLSVTYAKYHHEIEATLRYRISPFDGVLIDAKEQDSKLVPDAAALTKLEAGKDVGLFGNLTAEKTVNTKTVTYHLLEDLYPGMETREYPFLLTNGEKYDYAHVDIRFELCLRSMRNLPLTFKIKIGEGETAKEFTPDLAVKEVVDENAKEGDTPFYEYTFTLDPESEEYETLLPYFILSGDAYTEKPIRLLVDWPIVQKSASNGLKYDTNDSRYMKEVEVIEVYAKLTSQITTDPHVTPENANGVLALDYTAEESDFTYSADFRAVVTGKTNANENGYFFRVNNGLDNKAVTPEKIAVGRNTTYELTVRTPYETVTNAMAYALYLRGEDVDETTGAPIETWTELEPVTTEYRWYDDFVESPTYGTYEVYTKEQADAWIAGEPDNQHRVYLVSVYAAATLDNGTDKATFAEDEYRLVVTGGLDQLASLNKRAAGADPLTRIYKITIEADVTVADPAGGED